MTDIRSAESSVNKAQATLEQWAERWQAKFFAPIAEDMLRQLMLKMSPEQHMILRQQDPAAYDAAMKKLGMGGE